MFKSRKGSTVVLALISLPVPVPGQPPSCRPCHWDCCLLPLRPCPPHMGPYQVCRCHAATDYHWRPQAMPGSSLGCPSVLSPGRSPPDSWCPSGDPQREWFPRAGFLRAWPKMFSGWPHSLSGGQDCFPSSAAQEPLTPQSDCNQGVALRACPRHRLRDPPPRTCHAPQPYLGLQKHPGCLLPALSPGAPGVPRAAASLPARHCSSNPPPRPRTTPRPPPPGRRGPIRAGNARILDGAEVRGQGVASDRVGPRDLEAGPGAVWGIVEFEGGVAQGAGQGPEGRGAAWRVVAKVLGLGRREGRGVGRAHRPGAGFGGAGRAGGAGRGVRTEAMAGCRCWVRRVGLRRGVVWVGA